MTVLRPDREAIAAEAPDRIDGGGASPLRQRRSNVNRDVAIGDRSVRLQVLALEVGVDRHLEGAASADRRDEVDRDDAAPASGKLDRFIRQIQFHRFTQPTSVTNSSSELDQELVGRSAENEKQEHHRPHQQVPGLHGAENTRQPSSPRIVRTTRH